MRRYIRYDRLMAIATALCLCLSFASCSEEGGASLPEGPELCTVTITLQTSRQAQPTKTKADGNDTPTDPWEGWGYDEEYERDITDWLVVAYGTDGKLVGYTSSNGTYNQGDEDSRTSVEWELPVSTYRFYAFANWKSLEGGEELYKSITDPEKTEAELIRGVQLLATGNSIDGRNTTPGKFGGAESSRQRIPMSSYAQTHTLVSHTKGQPTPAENQFAIPLIRMIGKVQVEITNMLDQALTVNQLDIINLRKGSLPVWFLPWEISGSEKFLEFNNKNIGTDAVAHVAPNFPGTTNVVAPDHLFIEEIIPVGDERIISAKGEHTYSRYIPETNAPIGNDGGGIQLGIDIENRAQETKHLTGFDFVRRNDLLVIPVRITNITTKIEVAEQRLPIGVYPTALAYGEKDGVQVLAPIKYILQAAGDLSIRFSITKIEGVDGDFKIKGYTANPDGDVAGEKFSTLLWMNDYNTGDLITSVSIGDHKHTTEKEIKIPDSVLTSDSKGGSFTVHTQELGGTFSATLILTLVVNYGEDMKQEMQIPYTIKIWNYEPKNETQP